MKEAAYRIYVNFSMNKKMFDVRRIIKPDCGYIYTSLTPTLCKFFNILKKENKYTVPSTLAPK